MSMKLTAAGVTVFSYISLAIMLVMLLLIWFRIVPDTLLIPFFTVAVVLSIARIVLRIRLAKATRLGQERLTPSGRA